jgi:membrane protease YdiL (CAAX protease family)
MHDSEVKWLKPPAPYPVPASPWGLSDVLVGFLWGYVFFPHLLTSLVQVLSPGMMEGDLFSWSQVGIVLGWLVFWMLTARMKWHDILSGLALQRGPYFYQYLTLSVVGVVAILFLFGWLGSLWDGPQPDPYAHLEPETLPALSWFAICVSPFLEELVFRGFTQTVLEKLSWAQLSFKSAAIWAAIITPILFTLLHSHYLDSPLAMGSVLVMGILFSALRLFSGSVWPGILGHLLNNVIANWALWEGMSRGA